MPLPQLAEPLPHAHELLGDAVVQARKLGSAHPFRLPLLLRGELLADRVEPSRKLVDRAQARGDLLEARLDPCIARLTFGKPVLDRVEARLVLVGALRSLGGFCGVHPGAQLVELGPGGRNLLERARKLLDAAGKLRVGCWPCRELLHVLAKRRELRLVPRRVHPGAQLVELGPGGRNLLERARKLLDAAGKLRVGGGARGELVYLLAKSLEPGLVPRRVHPGAQLVELGPGGRNLLERARKLLDAAGELRVGGGARGELLYLLAKSLEPGLVRAILESLDPGGQGVDLSARRRCGSLLSDRVEPLPELGELAPELCDVLVWSRGLGRNRVQPRAKPVDLAREAGELVDPARQLVDRLDIRRGPVGELVDPAAKAVDRLAGALEDTDACVERRKRVEPRAELVDVLGHTRSRSCLARELPDPRPEGFELGIRTGIHLELSRQPLDPRGERGVSGRARGELRNRAVQRGDLVHVIRALERLEPRCKRPDLIGGNRFRRPVGDGVEPAPERGQPRAKLVELPGGRRDFLDATRQLRDEIGIARGTSGNRSDRVPEIVERPALVLERVQSSRELVEAAELRAHGLDLCRDGTDRAGVGRESIDASAQLRDLCGCGRGLGKLGGDLLDPPREGRVGHGTCGDLLDRHPECRQLPAQRLRQSAVLERFEPCCEPSDVLGERRTLLGELGRPTLDLLDPLLERVDLVRPRSIAGEPVGQG